MTFDVAADGSTQNVEAISSYPGFAFREATVAAVEQWQYYPKLKNDRPIDDPEQDMVMTFELELSEDDDPDNWLTRFIKVIYGVLTDYDPAKDPAKQCG